MNLSTSTYRLSYITLTIFGKLINFSKIQFPHMTKDITTYDKGLARNTIRMKEIENYFIHLGDFNDNPGVNYELYIDKLDLLF